MASGHELTDSLKPALPYVAGAQFDIRQHVPPRPAGPRYLDQSRHEKLARREPRPDYLQLYGTPSRCCLARPPPSTEPLPNQQSYRLVVVEQLATRDGRGSQIVTCQVGVNKAVLVAKIYDPLYYDWLDGYDGVEMAGEDYSREATAYDILTEEGHNGEFAPRYFGAWTFDTPLLDGSLRPVRMILMDYVPFPSMLTLIVSGKFKEIPEDTRMQVLAKTMESQSWLMFYGVGQGDLSPRNVLVDPDETRREQPRPVLIDFGRAKLRGIDWFSSRHDGPQERPKFPATSFGRSWGDFHEWVPKRMRSSKRRTEWFEQQWGCSTVFEPPDPRKLKLWQEQVDCEDEEETTPDEKSRGQLETP